MRAQRVRAGESRMEMQAAKWTVEGAVNGSFLFSSLRRMTCVNCQGYDSIL